MAAKDFLKKYRCLADKDTSLPQDDKAAAMYILKSLALPETEWQVGKTRVFLRNSVFEPLEDRRKILLAQKMVIIQKVWRGYSARKQFVKLRAATIVLQKHFRGSRQRIAFLKIRRAAITMQSHFRGFLARELVAALKKKKQAEEEERRRLKRLEDERVAKEKAERSMEESFKAAQMELLTLARLAEHKSQKVETDVDLNDIFKILEDTTKHQGKEEKAFVDVVTAELESQFQQAQEAIPPSTRKPTRPAPKPPQAGAQSRGEATRTGPQAKGGEAGSQAKGGENVRTGPQAKGGENVRTGPQAKGEGAKTGLPAELSRTERRRRRVERKPLGIEEDQGPREERFDPSAYPMLKFAEMYFNDFPRDTGGFSTLTLRRAPKVTDAIPKAEMLSYSKSGSLPTSLVHMHDPENVNLACNIFKDLCKLLKGELKPEQAILTIQSTIAYGIERPELRDEIFCQLIRQVTDNPKEDAVLKGWHFMALCTVAFSPSKNFNKVSHFQTTFVSLCPCGES